MYSKKQILADLQAGRMNKAAACSYLRAMKRDTKALTAVEKATLERMDRANWNTFAQDDFPVYLKLLEKAVPEAGKPAAKATKKPVPNHKKKAVAKKVNMVKAIKKPAAVAKKATPTRPLTGRALAIMAMAAGKKYRRLTPEGNPLKSAAAVAAKY